MLHIDSKDGELVRAEVEGDVLSILKDVSASVLLLGEAISKQDSRFRDFSRAILFTIMETLMMNGRGNFSSNYALVSEAIEEFGELFNIYQETNTDLDESSTETEERRRGPKISLEEIKEIIKNMPREII